MSDVISEKKNILGSSPDIGVKDTAVSIISEKHSRKPSSEKNEVILSVRHLKQYFRFSHGKYKYNKAVHDVSFDIHKGEVLGLVGESGCGKTTTGRSIIKLYDITSGSIYFEGQRIAAGTRWNEKEIKWKTIKAEQEIRSLKAKMHEELESVSTSVTDDLGYKEVREATLEKYNKKIGDIRARLDSIIKEQRTEIRKANFDNDNCDKVFEEKQIAIVRADYSKKFHDLFAESKGNKKVGKDFIDLLVGYLEAYHIARNDRLMNRMQMIFQDPIASLDPRMTVREIIAEGLKIRGVHSKKIIDTKVRDVLLKVGLVPEMADRYPHEFSGGQRQRIGIARALIMNPDLIIADEPVSALDVSIQAQVINLLNDLKDTRYCTRAVTLRSIPLARRPNKAVRKNPNVSK